MKKYIILIIIVIIVIVFLLFMFFKGNIFNTKNNSNTSSVKLSANINSKDTTLKLSNKEQEIASYSTEIKDDSPGRLTNINITCTLLNNVIINPNQIFSFNEIVGQPSSERGYQEATVIIDDEYEQAIGGGNCQVSSTLYNAVLAVPYLEVTERSEHGLPVTYVPEGKDAAVSYGSLDLKFKNNSNKKIRINMTTDNKTITAKITEI